MSKNQRGVVGNVGLDVGEEVFCRIDARRTRKPWWQWKASGCQGEVRVKSGFDCTDSPSDLEDKTVRVISIKRVLGAGRKYQ